MGAVAKCEDVQFQNLKGSREDRPGSGRSFGSKVTVKERCEKLMYNVRRQSSLQGWLMARKWCVEFRSSSRSFRLIFGFGALML